MVKPKDQGQPEQPSVPVPVAPSQVMLGPQLPAGYVNPQVSELNEAMRMRVPLNAKVPMGEGYWVRKNNKWNFTPKNTPSSPNTDMIVPEEQLVAERKAAFAARVQKSLMGPVTGGIFKGDISKIVKTPFRFARSNIGSPIAGVSSNIVDAIPFTEWAENAVGSTLNFGSNYGSKAFNFAVRDNIRRSMTAAMTPLQVMENLVMFLPTMIASIPGGNTDLVKSDASIWDQVRGLISNTTIGQQFAKEGALGFVNPFDESSTGTGYFPAGTAEEQRNKLEERLRPELLGQTATVGRLFAGLGVYANLYEAGDDNHSLLSGTIDALFQVAFDPMNAFLPGSKAIKGIETFADSPTALASTRKLIKAGAAVTPETIVDAERVISMMDESAQLSEAAVSLVTRQPGITWSGDRTVVARGGQPIEQFLDIGADGPINTGNLVGPGLYDTDLSPVATSYNLETKAGDIPLNLGETEITVPVVGTQPGEAIVYEFETPAEGFLTINGEETWTLDQNVPWNLRSAVTELGFTGDNALEIERRLVELGFEPAAGGVRLQNVNPEDYFIGINSTEKLVDVRRKLGAPVEWLKNNLNLKERSRDYFTNRSLSYLLDDTLDQTPFLGWSDDLSVDYDFVLNPETGASEYKAVASSSRGKALALAIDNPQTASNYHPTPVQALQRQIIDWEFSINNAYATPEAKAVLTQKINEAKMLQERFAAVAENFTQRKTAQFTTELAGSKLDRKLFDESVAEFRQLTQEYRSFTSELKEMSQVFKSIGLGATDIDVSKIKSIQNFSSLSPETQSLLAYSRISQGSFDEFVKQSLYQMRVSLDFSISLGDVGPFKNITLMGGDVGFTDAKISSFQPDIIPYPTRVTDVVNDWFKLKGVDAISYDGGVRIGSEYGTHTARVVLSPSKLKVRNVRTGEMLPTLLAKQLVADGQQLEVTAKEIAQARGYMQSQGLIDAARKSADPNQYNVWKISGSGRNTFNAIANDSDAYNIWKTWLKGRSPKLAQKLSLASTPEEVEKIFDLAVVSPDAFEHLYQLPGWSGNVVGEIGYRTKQKISTNSSLAAMLPRSTVLPLDDFAAGAKNLHDTLILLKTPNESRITLMNEYLRIVAQDDFAKIRGDLYDFAGKFKTETIRTKIQPVIDRLRAPSSKLFEEMTPFERITMNRRTQIAQEIEDFVRRNEAWANPENQITKYTIDDVGRGVPLDWINGNGLGPLYPSQQNQTAISLIPFEGEELDELLRLTSNWAELSTMARTLPAMGRTIKVLDSVKQNAFWVQSVWKKAVLFSGRYVARAVPEEMMRTSLSGEFKGEFSYVSEILSGRLNQDIYGRIMPRIGEADDIALKLDEALVLQTRITRATELGNTVKAAILQRRLDKIDTIELQARLDEVEAIIEKEGASVRDAMIGPVPDKAADTVLGSSIPQFVRAGVQQTVFKTENPRLWLKGVAQSVIERSANPASSVVSRAMLDGSPWSLEYVAKQMYDGEYRSFFEKYFKAEGRLKPDYDWDSLDGARKYVEFVSKDLQQLTGGHPFLLKVISDGGFVIDEKSFSLGRRTAEGNIPSSDFIRILNQGDLTDPSVPAFASWSKAPDSTVVYPSVGTFERAKSQGLFSFFMQHAYGRTSDKFARIPLWNARKWNLIADKIPMLSKEEAAKLSEVIQSYNLPNHVFENIADNIPRARGTATLAQLEEIAGRQATEDTIGLLFDSSKRSLFGRNHRLLFPFFDAFREVGVQMVKTAIDPRKLHRIDKAAEGLSNLRIGGPGEMNLIGPGDVDQDGKNEGFVYKDPQTEQLTFNLPLVGGAAKALTGIPFDYKVNVGSLSMATSVIPSVGPYVSLTYSAIPNRQGETWDKLNELVVPFGDPPTELQSYFTPLAIRRFVQGVAAGTPFERVAFFMGNPNSDPVYKTLQSRTLMAELASGKYTQDETGIREAMQSAQDKGNTLWWLRGVTQFFSPAAPISQFYAKKDEKLVPLGVLLDSIRKTENDIRDQGGSYQDQIDAVVNQYGDFVVPYLASISKSNIPGAESSKAFYDFKSKNGKLFAAYPEIAGYFGPSTNEFDQEIYNIQKRAGELQALPIEEVSKQIEQLWGNLRYNRFDRQLTQALGETPAKAYALSLGEQQIRASLPNWDRNLSFSEYNNRINNAVNSIVRISTDEKFADLPAIAPLKEYLVVRNQIVNLITQSSGLTNVNSWKNNRGGMAEREALKIIGEKFANENPDFKPLWDNVLSREFKSLSDQELLLAKSGQLP